MKSVIDRLKVNLEYAQEDCAELEKKIAEMMVEFEQVENDVEQLKRAIAILEKEIS